MNCPRNCNSQLLITERAGVEVDYCPTCRGVWLDRGELDKILERANSDFQAVPRNELDPRALRPDMPTETRRKRDDDWDDDDDHYYKKKRKKSFLSEIFDF